MVEVYGKENCDSCTIAKTQLELVGVEYDYYDTKNMRGKELQSKLKDALNKAKKAEQQMLPIILKDGEITTVQDIVKELA